MTQDDLMQKDQCIVLDENDGIVGYDSKWNVHRWHERQPSGIRHRAFSVFLFDKEGRLLLQKRADTKITFPSVWTNTCCSHPLTGMTPSEEDSPEAVADGTVMGAKNGAIRKLGHELGIKRAQLPIEKFTFMTRMHYWANDTLTHGPYSEWGEHEIDYLLFAQVDSVDLAPNPEEVSETKWVTSAELETMMAESPEMWSPWFALILANFIVPGQWWEKLPQALAGELVNQEARVAIRRFAPPAKFAWGTFARHALKSEERAKSGDMGGGKVGDAALKQGAYGKVRIIKESKLMQITHCDEIMAMVRFKMRGGLGQKMNTEGNPDLEYCNDMLCKVSRSFTEVIRQLPTSVTRDVMIFYLVLRALDTIEDDMDAFTGERAGLKLSHLRSFHRVALEDEEYFMAGVGEGDELALLERFGPVVRVFQSLPPASREIIADITRQMGEGMASFAGVDLKQGTQAVEDYNRYCHYVAGLVGHGLSRLFVAAGLEKEEVGRSLDLANSMGLFLQKTNIIRDYLEDFVDGRAWWPQEVWRQYKVDSLGDFAERKHRAAAMCCLNHLVTDAIELMPECIAYMEQLQNPEVFQFCAIPQVMAAATLDKLYGNAQVFQGVCKIRKGLSCKMMLGCGGMDGLCYYFGTFARRIRARVASGRGCGTTMDTRTIAACNRAIALCDKHETRAQKLQRVAGVMWMPAAVAAVAYLMMIVKTPAATVLPASS